MDGQLHFFHRSLRVAHSVHERKPNRPDTGLPVFQVVKVGADLAGREVTKLRVTYLINAWQIGRITFEKLLNKGHGTRLMVKRGLRSYLLR